jgi:P2 family phage contractile tail tube protein
MAAVNSVLRKFVMYCDGFGKLGDCEAVTLPDLKLKTEEFRGGGMDTPVEVDLGTEKVELKFTLTSVDEQVIGLWGLKPGSSKAFTMRGSLAGADGEVSNAVCQVRGVIKQIAFKEFKPGSKANMDFTVMAEYYKLSKGALVLVELDIANVKRIVGGTDQLIDDRTALGL